MAAVGSSSLFGNNQMDQSMDHFFNPNKLKQQSSKSRDDTPASVKSQRGSGRRIRVKTACTNCKAAKARCDAGRPCSRCVKRGYPHRCVSAIPKRRGRKRSLDQVKPLYSYHISQFHHYGGGAIGGLPPSLAASIGSLNMNSMFALRNPQMSQQLSASAVVPGSGVGGVPTPQNKQYQQYQQRLPIKAGNNYIQSLHNSSSNSSASLIHQQQNAGATMKSPAGNIRLQQRMAHIAQIQQQKQIIERRIEMLALQQQQQRMRKVHSKPMGNSSGTDIMSPSLYQQQQQQQQQQQTLQQNKFQAQVPLQKQLFTQQPNQTAGQQQQQHEPQRHLFKVHNSCVPHHPLKMREKIPRLVQKLKEQHQEKQRLQQQLQQKLQQQQKGEKAQGFGSSELQQPVGILGMETTKMDEGKQKMGLLSQLKNEYPSAATCDGKERQNNHSNTQWGNNRNPFANDLGLHQLMNQRIDEDRPFVNNSGKAVAPAERIQKKAHDMKEFLCKIQRQDNDLPSPMETSKSSSPNHDFLSDDYTSDYRSDADLDSSMFSDSCFGCNDVLDDDLPASDALTDLHPSLLSTEAETEASSYFSNDFLMTPSFYSNNS